MPVEIPENFICDTLLLLLEEFKKKKKKICQAERCIRYSQVKVNNDLFTCQLGTSENPQ